MNLKSRHHFILPPLDPSQNTALLARFIKHHCCDKLKFRRKSEAIKRAMSVMDASFKADACSVYHCKFCGGWHFSSRISCGYTKEDIFSKVKDLHGKKRACKLNKLRQKNKVIAMLQNSGFLEDAETIVYKPTTVSSNPTL